MSSRTGRQHESGGCVTCGLGARHAACTAAAYTLMISIFVILLYSWRIGVNMQKYVDLQDVYYGVQISYCAIIGTQAFMVMLSIFLFYGIYKENVAFIVPWIVGCITFMALESMAMVYSNILRDHVNKQFDAICKAEIAFLIPRILLNTNLVCATCRKVKRDQMCICICCVIRFYNLVRSGASWKAVDSIEL